MFDVFLLVIAYLEYKLTNSWQVFGHKSLLTVPETCDQEVFHDTLTSDTLIQCINDNMMVMRIMFTVIIIDH